MNIDSREFYNSISEEYDDKMAPYSEENRAVTLNLVKEMASENGAILDFGGGTGTAVSYTHLTLPTILRV